MLIEGPLRVSIVETTDGLGRELHLAFTDSFQSLSITEQTAALQTYVDDLRSAVEDQEGHSAERQGMLTILQITEQPLPHVATGELALEETIIVEVQPEFSLQGGLLGGLRLN